MRLPALPCQNTGRHKAHQQHASLGQVATKPSIRVAASTGQGEARGEARSTGAAALGRERDQKAQKHPHPRALPGQERQGQAAGAYAARLLKPVLAAAGARAEAFTGWACCSWAFTPKPAPTCRSGGASAWARAVRRRLGTLASGWPVSLTEAMPMPPRLKELLDCSQLL